MVGLITECYFRFESRLTCKHTVTTHIEFPENDMGLYRISHMSLAPSLVTASGMKQSTSANNLWSKCNITIYIDTKLHQLEARNEFPTRKKVYSVQ